MLVTKRDGRKESVRFDKITDRIRNLCEGLSLAHISVEEIAQKVISGLVDGVSTVKLDELAAQTAASMATNHPDYGRLAARIAISNLYKETDRSFANTARRLYKYVRPHTGEHAPLISRELYQLSQAHAARLDSWVDYPGLLHPDDLGYDYFGFKTLERSYLLHIEGKIVERPQHLWLRVALGIHGADLKAAEETYVALRERWFTHATPTLFNAGTPVPQLSSCFLLALKEDSIPGIYDTLKQCAQISQGAGGIGLSIHNIRAKGAYIKGTNGRSNGIVPMLRNFDMTARYVDQGGGKRKGAFAIYLEPWHADISEFLDLKKNHGKDECRARDLFYGLWVPDLFMQRVEEDKEWSLFSPDTAPGLYEVHSEAFERLYTKYEEEGRAVRVVKARTLWQEILSSQVETGTPYLLYKDAANRKSNQQNLGTIRSSNLCTEIIEYTSPEEVAVCNLASLSLPRFVTAAGNFDHQRLAEMTRIVTRNLNKVIDINHYPLPEARYSNLRHRPIGIGIQGLADTFLKLKLAFDSAPARKLNKEIFETIYYAALSASIELAREKGAYETFQGSPASKGLLQFDLWGVTPDSGRWDWDSLKEEIKIHGLRNSLLLAPMPTASTAQILGNSECFEPYTSNIFLRRVIAGEFIVVNKYLLEELIALQLWNAEMKNDLIAANGSVQHLPGVPADIKMRYRTVWEIPQRSLIDMAADRGPYICQSQSLNLYLPHADFGRLTSMHFYGFKKGLKTGVYYTRIKPVAEAIKFTVVQKQQPAEPQLAEAEQCSIENGPDCVMCSA